MPSIKDTTGRPRLQPQSRSRLSNEKIADTCPAQLEAIWNDTDRLRDWTWDMVLATTEIPCCYEGYIRADEESKRKWLRWLKEADPRRFIQLLDRRPDLVPFTQKRQVGRPRGRANKPGRAEAWEMNQYIHSKWKEIFGHRHRKGIADLALKIRRWRLRLHRAAIERLQPKPTLILFDRFYSFILNE